MKQREIGGADAGATAVRANPLGQRVCRLPRQAGEAGGGGSAGTIAAACLDTQLLSVCPCTRELASYMSFAPFRGLGAASREPCGGHRASQVHAQPA